MTLRWLTCFSLSASAILQSATVTGRIDVISDQHDRTPADVVVWLEPEQPLTTQPAALTRARLLQKNKTFDPHVLAVQVNTLVDFPNDDPIFHNAFSNYDGQLFDLGLYAPGKSKAVRFRRPGIVRIFCNIHPSMSAVIVVVDTPYFTMAKSGAYRLTDVPPGDYTLRWFDERADLAHTTWPKLTVDDAATERGPDIQISEAGYVQLPHKNKYGRDYSPDSDAYGADGPPK